VAGKRVAVLHYEMRESGRFVHDPVVDRVAEALREGGHEPVLLPARNDVREVVDALSTLKADLVFNLCETFAAVDGFEIQVASLLELCRVRFTGSGSQGLFLAFDKGIAKRIFVAEGVPCPRYALFEAGRAEPELAHLAYPLIVKPAASDASLGIARESLVHDEKALRKRVEWLRAEMKQDALVEEFLDGREFYVAVLGWPEPEALPPVELHFQDLPAGVPRLVSRRAKWVSNSVEHNTMYSETAAGLPPDLDAALRRTALDAVRAVRVQDYARVDLRLDATGKPNVLEVNPNPYLHPDSEFAIAAEAGGLPYARLVARIVETALQREPRRRRMLLSPPQSSPSPPTGCADPDAAPAAPAAPSGGGPGGA
jgi:D-alanine-D-alanine ligase